MAKVEIYTTPICGYCARAKALLARKNISFIEIDLHKTPNKRDEMISRARGRLTVPQIFINGKSIGGCDDLYALERSAQLDKILAEKS